MDVVMADAPQANTKFNQQAHNIIPFHALLMNDSKAIADLKKELQTRGWAVLRFPPNGRAKMDGWREGRSNYVLTASQGDIETLARFFAQPMEEKATAAAYASVPHKESIHITTPIWDWKEMRQKQLGPVLKPTVVHWMETYDSAAIDLLENLAGPIFGLSKATLAHRADLPIAFGRHTGMLDIARYANRISKDTDPEIGFSTQDVNCVPHYDPGLFSISFFSSYEGLQLQDPATKTWFDGPVNTQPGQEDLGVLWLGAAASKATQGALREGVHRVVYPRTAHPRLTAWYEVCTVEQVNAEIRGRKLPKAGGTINLPNLPGSKPLTLDSDSEPNPIERHYGIPMSKVMSRSDSFAAAYSDDVEKSGKRMFGNNNYTTNDFF